MSTILMNFYLAFTVSQAPGEASLLEFTVPHMHSMASSLVWWIPGCVEEETEEETGRKTSGQVLEDPE